MRYLLTNILTYSLTQVFNASTARSWSSEVYNPCPGVMEGVPASRDYEGGFSHELMLKDLSLALRAAADAGASVSCRVAPTDARPHHVLSYHAYRCAHPMHTPGRRAGTELRARDAAVHYVGRGGHGGQGLWRCAREVTLLISPTRFTVRLRLRTSTSPSEQASTSS